MKAQATNLKDAYVLTTPRYEDERGFFIESFSSQRFKDAIGKDVEFVQDERHDRGILPKPFATKDLPNYYDGKKVLSFM